jgi:hypothetical protein
MSEKETTTHDNKAPATGNSPSGAIPIGSAAKIPIIPGFGPGPKIGNLLVSILEVIRGVEAEDRIQSRGIAVELLKSGFENLLLRVKAEYVRVGKGPREQPYYLSQDHFLACSADSGTEFKVFPFSGQPDDSIIGQMFTQGDSREGWLICQVPKNELKPLLIFRRQNVDNVWGLWSDIWFKLYPIQ